MEELGPITFLATPRMTLRRAAPAVSGGEQYCSDSGGSDDCGQSDTVPEPRRQSRGSNAAGPDPTDDQSALRKFYSHHRIAWSVAGLGLSATMNPSFSGSGVWVPYGRPHRPPAELAAIGACRPFIVLLNRLEASKLRAAWKRWAPRHATRSNPLPRPGSLAGARRLGPAILQGRPPRKHHIIVSHRHPHPWATIPKDPLQEEWGSVPSQPRRMLKHTSPRRPQTRAGRRVQEGRRVCLIGREPCCSTGAQPASCHVPPCTAVPCYSIHPVSSGANKEGELMGWVGRHVEGGGVQNSRLCHASDQAGDDSGGWITASVREYSHQLRQDLKARLVGMSR
jgi:hypothetical protein